MITEAEIGVMQPQAEEYQLPPEAERGKEGHGPANTLLLAQQYLFQILGL